MYSVRMRASKSGNGSADGEHVCGAERIAGHQDVEHEVQALVNRAMSHERGSPERVHITIESIPTELIETFEALPTSQRVAQTVHEARQIAIQCLVDVSVSERAALNAIQWLSKGPNPLGGVMRGAIVMDADTGVRYEPDLSRGVRVNKVDWRADVRQSFLQELANTPLASERILEALAIATKVINTQGTVAELCWSDDPSYVTGYVASAKDGYIRIPHLKKHGDPLGGRVFFVRNVHKFEEYEQALKRPALIVGFNKPLLLGE